VSAVELRSDSNGDNEMTWHLFITKGHASLETDDGRRLLEFYSRIHETVNVTWDVFTAAEPTVIKPIHQVSDKRLVQYCRGIIANITDLSVTTITVHELRNQ